MKGGLAIYRREAEKGLGEGLDLFSRGTANGTPAEKYEEEHSMIKLPKNPRSESETMAHLRRAYFSGAVSGV